MKRRFQGLEETTQLADNEVPDGLFLVRVEGVQYRRHAQKPFYWLRLAVLEPPEFTGRIIFGRLYCTPKAVWKLGWFLRDFLYDVELLGRAEVDEKPCSGVEASSRSAALRSAADLSLTWRVLLPPMGRVLHSALAAGAGFGDGEMTWTESCTSCP
jgi:hypothetical protein